MHMTNRGFVQSFACFLAATMVATAQRSVAPIKVADYKEAIKVACIGDSITAGYRAGGKQAAWPGQLAGMLGEKWAVSNFGVSGKTLMNTGDAYQKTPDFASALALNPDVVLIMLGTNDTKPRFWNPRKDNFEGDYRALINEFASLSSKPVVFLCYPPPVGGKNAYAIHAEPILEQIPVIDKIANDLKLGVIDVHGALKNKPGLFPDSVHPSREGAVEIAKTIYTALTGEAAPDVAPPEPARAKKGKKERISE